METKIAIVKDEFIPNYRIPFFRLLAQKSKINYVVYHGLPLHNAGYQEVDDLLEFDNVKVKNYQFSILGYRFVYQPIIREILFNSYSAIVLGHEVKFFSYIILFFIYKILGKPVILWGHGFDKEQDRKIKLPLLALVLARFKAWLACSADMYIAYTKGGSEKLKQLGVSEDKLAVVRNTLDMEEQCSLHAKFIDADPISIGQVNNLRLDSIVLLYVGRVYAEKRIEELLHLVNRINSEKLCSKFVEAIIIGDGPELERLKEEEKDNRGIHFLGAVYNQEIVASYMRISSAMVIPGKVGLAVNHAFAHGLPVITRASTLHAPEIEYIESGVNGLIVPGDFDEFVGKTVDYLNSPEQQRKMSEAALETRKTLTLEFMVKAFDTAVMQAIDRKGKINK